MLRKSARISRITFSSSTTKMRAASEVSTYSVGDSAEASGVAADELAARASRLRASRLLVLKNPPGDVLAKSQPRPGGRQSPGRSQGSPFELGLLRGQVFPALLAFAG